MSQVLKLALPLAGSRLLSMLMGFVGVIILSRYNATSLAASALISSVQVIVISAGMAVIFSTNILVGQYYGSKQYDKINIVLQQSIILALLLSLLLMIIFWSTGPILSFFLQPKNIVVIVEQYFYIFSFGVPAIFVITAIQQTLFAMQKQFIALIVDLASLTLTTVLGVSLTYGKLRCPELGVSGLAYAIVIQAWLLVFCLLYYLKSSLIFKNITNVIDKQILFKLFHIGWPISISITGEILSLFALTIMAGWLGLDALKAIQVTSQYLLLLIIPIFGISQAISILSSHLLGANQGRLLKKYGESAIKLASLLISIALIVAILFPRALIEIFINTHDITNQSTIDLISILLVVIVIGQLFDLLRNICSAALRSMNFTMQPMLISMTCLWFLSLPLAYIFGFMCHFGLTGMLIAYNIGMTFAGVTLYHVWLKKVSGYEIQVTVDIHSQHPEEVLPIHPHS